MADRRNGMVTNENRSKFLSDAELGILLSYVKSQADLARKRGTTRAVVDELIVLLLARAGLRPNEVCALKIEDLPAIHGEKTVWIRDTTGEIIRKVDIDSDMTESLARFVRLYRKGTEQEDFLLESERGNRFGYMSVYSKVRRIGEEAGVGKLSPATLRHTYMVRLYEAEQDLRYVQEQTGYASRRTVARYVTIAGDQKKTVGRGSIESTGEGPIERKGRDSELTQTCEGCGAKIATGGGDRIESGQLLCPQCLKYFRTV
jgi:integrase